MLGWLWLHRGPTVGEGGDWDDLEVSRKHEWRVVTTAAVGMSESTQG